MEKQKICIIGGGLSGLITALVLSKLNLKIDLITGNINKNLKSNKTIAISQSNYDYLKKLNIFESLKKGFWPCSEMKLYAETKKKIFDKIFEFKSKKKHILYMMTSSNIMKSAIKNIKKNKLITFKSNKMISEITSSGALKAVKFKNKNISKYNLIIVCAGSNSSLVKNLFDEKVFEHSYEETSATTIVNHQLFQNNIVRQIFFDNEILALLPISNTKTSIVWSVKKKIMNKYRSDNNKIFKKKIKLYTKDYIKKIKFFNHVEYKDLNLLIRKKYYKDRVILFGDALHLVHPLVGQGFNMVLRDLASLEELIKEKINLGLDVGSLDALSQFTSTIKPRNFIHSIGIDFIKNLFSIEKRTFKDFRNKIMIKLNNNNFAKKLFYNIANEGFKF